MPRQVQMGGGMSVSFEEGAYLMATAMVVEAQRAADAGDRGAQTFLDDWKDYFVQRRHIPLGKSRKYQMHEIGSHS